MSGTMQRLARLFRGGREIREEVDEEIRFHLEMRAAELEGAGMSRFAARQEALRRFGSVEETSSVCYESDLRRENRMKRREYVGEMMQDLGHGLRQFRRRPGFGIVAVLTLGLGIGAATAVFGVADHVLLRPLAYAEAERVVTLWEADGRTGEDHREVSPGNYLAWAEHQRSFEALGLAEPYGFDLTGEGPPQPLDAWLVTADYFDALGATPLLGRGFRAEDFQPNAGRVVVLSHDLWWRLGSDPSLVGRTVQLDGEAAAVVGVMPSWVEYPTRTEIWAPKVFQPYQLEDRESGYMRAVGRLKPGVTLEQAQADMDRAAAILAAEHPQTNQHQRVSLVPLEEQVLGGVRPALLLLLGAAGVLLLIACTNVAGLLLARGAERGHELGVRAALGAGRGRLARQLLTESALLAVVGGAVGAAIAPLGMRAMLALSPPDLPRLGAVAVDGRVLAFAFLAALATVLLFGLAPASRLSRTSSAGLLRSGPAAATAGAGRLRFRGALVVGEIALATILLIGAGLLARSFSELLANDPGFSTEQRATLQLFVYNPGATAEQRQQRVEEFAAAMRTVPGVEEVAIVSALPFHPQQISAQDVMRVEGAGEPRAGEEPRVFTTIASPNYFGVMGIPVVRGRGLTADDRADAPAVVVVNESLARRYFPGEDPVGRRVTVGAMSAPRTREIVGVVRDVRPTGLDSDPRPELFVPYAQSGTGSVTFVARARSDAAALLPALSARVWEVDPQQTVDHAATVEALISESLVTRRFSLLLLGSFSLVALLLAAIGIYGLISFATSQRRREIGVRLALGAHPSAIVRMVVREGVRLGVPGVLLGMAGALVLTRFMAHMLYGVTPTDPLTFLQLGLLLLAVSALGAYLPARRAARVDPATSLRQGD